MKVMKSISSEGSKCARRLPISGGIRCVIYDPVVAKIRVNAFRVCKDDQRGAVKFYLKLHTASLIARRTLSASNETKIAWAICVKISTGGNK